MKIERIRDWSGRTLASVLGVASLAVIAGCASAGSGSGGGVPPGVFESTLPPIPMIIAPVSLYVEYPDSLQSIAVTDSNFIFGTVGTGDATLIIDGQFVTVEPNGAFLAWLPVPPPISGDTAWYRLTARRGSEVDTLSHPVLLPSVPFEGAPGSAWIDSTSVSVPTERWALPDERLALTFRGAPGLEAWLEARAGSIRLAETARPGVYRVAMPAAELHAAACTADGCDWVGETVPLAATLFLAGATDTASFAFDYPLRLLDPARLPVAELIEETDSINGTNGIVVGRPWRYGPFRWRFPEGTRAEVAGREDDRMRLRLAPGLHAWVSEEDARLVPGEALPPRSLVGDLRFEVTADRVSLRVPLSAPLPLQVEEPDDGTLELTLFGGTGHTDRVALGAGSRVVEDVRWMQLPGRYRLTVRLAEPVWGYRASYETLPGGRAELILDIRRPPPIRPDDPLAGRRIAVDPGHPWAGATGPTGLYEGDANLAIGRALERLLLESGAEPILIRPDTLPMGLYERTAAAIEADAELFVSIHNNALPDGVQPVGREGTSTYYHHPHSRLLARSVHEGMLGAMRLRDLGVYWGDLAVTRMTWMPSILTEGAFMMIPAHEAALRDPAFVELYARGLLAGIRGFLAQAALSREGFGPEGAR